MLNLSALSAIILTDVENPNLFPFPFKIHIGFVIIAFIFFALRFIFEKKLYQLIFAVAVPLSLLLWISESKTWFYTVGVVELVLMIAALVSSMFKKKKDTAENSKAE